MKYAFKNLLSLLKTERFIFAVMLFSVFISAWAMTFSYGLYHHYSALSTQEEGKGMSVSPEIALEKTLTRGDMVRYLYAVSPKTLDAMNIIVVYHRVPYLGRDNYPNSASICSRFVVRGGEILPSPYIIKLWDGSNMIVTGRYISDDEEKLGEAVALVNEDDNGHDDGGRTFTDDGRLVIDSPDGVYEYRIVGTHTSFGVVVPFLSIPEDDSIDSLIFSFEKQITRNQYDDLKNTAEEVIPGILIFPDLELPDEESVYIYNNMMIVSVLIAALTIINFAFLYSFILGKRTRTLAIMRICGCTEGRAWGICLGECCLICIPTFIIGVLIYIPFMKNVLSEPFEFIEEAYSLPVYAILFAIYAVMLFVIMGIMLKKQTSRELVEGRKGGAI